MQDSSGKLYSRFLSMNKGLRNSARNAQELTFVSVIGDPTRFLSCADLRLVCHALKLQARMICSARAIFVELLTEALAQTTVHAAVESLKLQKERHLREIPIIKHKKRWQEMQSAAPALSPSSAAQADITTDTLDGTTGAASEMNEELSVYRTMQECDSLLKFLKNRQTGQNAETHPPSALRTGVKTPKDDKTIIEELRMHNEALRGHILELLRENEGYWKELQLLRQENVKLHLKSESVDLDGTVDESSTLAESTESEKSEKYYPNPHRMDINDLPGMELPPLEMPTFDFDSLNKLNSTLNESQ